MDQTVRMDTGSTVVIDLVVVKTLSVGFLVSGFKRDPEPILVALSLTCSGQSLQLVAQLAFSVCSPTIL
ncbi:MAG: hypothetical protein EZS28_043923 [Streblomastix strix]|uniref:Uncharacterized protein n=1 Tax=Streblomastix strix TaxID=222440 RepID=A0A5J4TSV2_9EUKA|nr:MAG: hypothetical protein EZS28_043923 [Streblomastix strix]